MLNQDNVTQVSYGPALAKMLSAFPLATEQSNGWWSHPDNPTFDFRENEDGSISIHSWTGRTREQILAMGGLSVADIYPKGYKTIKVRAKLDLLELSHARLIPWQFLFSLGLQDGYRYNGYSVVKVPYFNADGTQHTKIKIRKAIDGKYKHGWDEGTPGETIPYGLHKLEMASASGCLLIGEGESDAWASWFHGIPYLGIPGSNAQKCLKHVDIQALPPKIYILQEPDQAKRMMEDGQGFYKSVHNALRFMGYQGQIFCIDFEKVTGHKDPGALHIALWKESQTKDFKRIIEQAMEQAIPANDAQEKTLVFDIKDERVLKALATQDKQAIYALAPEITEMDAIEQDHIRLAVRDVWGKDFPMNEYNGLLRSAKDENERKRQGKPNIISARELMQKQFAPIDFAVPDILPMGLIIFGGKQKIGKSWFDLNLGLSVASGGIALGKYQVKQGAVLYMALEDTERRLQDRVRQLLAPGTEAPEDLHLVTSWARMDKEGIGALEKWIMEHPNARLIIIDPWVKVKPRVKSRHGETGYDADYEALEGIKRLADTYKICILIQFHLRKSSAEDPFDEVNATTGVTACADGFVSLKRARGEQEATLYASGRDYKEEVNIALSFNNGMWKVLGDGSSAVYYTLSKERRDVIDILSNALTPMTPKEIASLLAIPDGTMRKRLFDMKDDNQVEWRETNGVSGYVSLIPSPKATTNNDANYGNGSNASNEGNTGNGSNAIPTSSNQDEPVTENSERYQSVTDLITPVDEPVEPFEGHNEGGSVTSVTALPKNEPIPLDLLQEYRTLYQQLQQVPPEKTAPHGTLHWYVPESGMPTGQIPLREYGIRLQVLGKSKEIAKVRAGRDEMLRKLEQIK